MMGDGGESSREAAGQFGKDVEAAFEKLGDGFVALNGDDEAPRRDRKRPGQDGGGTTINIFND